MKTALLFLLFPAMALAGLTPIRLNTQHQPPYSIDNGTSRAGGVAVDMVRCVLVEMKRPAIIAFYPWLRAQYMVQIGVADGFFSATGNQDRDQYAILSAPIVPQRWNWYLLASSPDDPRDAAFKHKAFVGAYRGSNMQDWLKREGYNVDANPSDHERLLRMLMAKHLTAVLASDLAMDVAIDNLKVRDQLRVVLLEDRPMGVYFSRQFLSRQPANFLDQFNKAIPACRAKILPS